MLWPDRPTAFNALRQKRPASTNALHRKRIGRVHPAQPARDCANQRIGGDHADFSQIARLRQTGAGLGRRRKDNVAVERATRGPQRMRHAVMRLSGKAFRLRLCQRRVGCND